MISPTQSGSNLRMGRVLRAQRSPSHISKTVLSTVHFGPPKKTRTLVAAGAVQTLSGRPVVTAA